MVKLFCGPSHVFPPFSKWGVTVIVAVTGDVPGLSAVNAGMSPVPVAASPIDGVSLVQVYVALPPVVAVVKLTACVSSLLHTVWFAGWLTSAVGLTVMVKLFCGPSHVFPPFSKCGVTVIVAVTGDVPGLSAVNAGMSPVPVAASPIDGVSLVQVYVALPPVVAVVKLTACVSSLLHTVWFAGWLTSAVGLTVMVKLFCGPSHVFPPFSKCGVTVIVAVTGDVPGLSAVNAGMSPVPVAASPIDGVSLVQVYVALPPVVAVVKLTACVSSLLHTVWFAGWLTSAVGLTVMVKLFCGPSHVFPPFSKCGVTVIVAVTGDVPGLSAVNAGMSPVPVAASPIDGVSLVQVYVALPPVVAVVKVTACVSSLLHTVWSAGWLTSAVGLTVMVKLFCGPSHVFPPFSKWGVTVIVAVTGDVPGLSAVNAGMSPVPVAASPIDGVSLVQVYVALPPVVAVVKLTACVSSLLHTVWFAGWLTSAVGLTVMVKLFCGPSHVFPPFSKCGVTVIVAVTGDVPGLSAVNAGMSPVPVAASPIDGVSLVQVYVALPPVVAVVKVTACVSSLLHTVWSAGWLTSAVGLTVMVKLFCGPSHVFPPFSKWGVTVIVAVTGDVPGLSAVNAGMSPVPVAASPIDGVSLVQVYVALPPVVAVVKLTACVSSLLHTVWFAGWLTSAVGLTVMVKLFCGPSHVFPPFSKCGVTVIVAVTGDVPGLSAVNAGMSPVPVAASPIDGVSLVQVYVALPPVVAVVKVTACVSSLLHTVWSAGWLTSAVGLTVMVKLFCGPSHVFPPFSKCGVTVIVAVTGDVPGLSAVNAGMSPVPVAASPIDGVSLVQVYVALPPVVAVVKVTACVSSLLHTVWSAGWLTSAVGLTVMVKLFCGPSHVFPPFSKWGVTVIVAVTGDVPGLSAVNAGMSPVPVAASPIDGVSLVQVYVALPPVVAVVKVTACVSSLLHTVWSAGWLTSAVGLTVMVKLFCGPSHVFPPFSKCGVTVIVAVTGDVPGLSAVNAGMSPVPVAASPIDGVSLVQVYVALPPVVAVVKLTACVSSLLHTVWFAGWLTSAVGLIVMVKLFCGPSHVFPPFSKCGVTVIVAVTGDVPGLSAVNAGMSPVPVAASPIDGVSLVQVYVALPPVVAVVKVTACVSSLL